MHHCALPAVPCRTPLNHARTSTPCRPNHTAPHGTKRNRAPPYQPIPTRSRPASQTLPLLTPPSTAQPNRPSHAGTCQNRPRSTAPINTLQHLAIPRRPCPNEPRHAHRTLPAQPFPTFRAKPHLAGPTWTNPAKTHLSMRNLAGLVLPFSFELHEHSKLFERGSHLDGEKLRIMRESRR